MGQQGITDFKYPQLVSLSRYNDITNIPYDPEDVNEFDIAQFNRKFEQNKELTTGLNYQLDQERLQAMNQQPEVKKPWQLSISEILVGIKDSWFGLLTDLLQQKFFIETFTKDNRFFYIGLTIVVIIIIIYLFNVIFGDNDQNICDRKIYEVHYIHHNLGDNYERMYAYPEYGSSLDSRLD